MLGMAACATQNSGQGSGGAGVMASTSPQDSIRQVLTSNLSQTGPLTVDQIAVDGDFSLVTWSQGDGGGVAVLKKEGNNWTILTSGGGWPGLSGLESYGVPAVNAENLLSQIDPNWRSYESSPTTQ